MPPSSQFCWALLTGEYPPQPGGVADYTRLVARGLAAAGDEVHVFAPRCDAPSLDEPGVHLHRLRDHFGPRGLAQLDRLLSRLPRPLRIVLQYTPHAFGYKAMNLPLCWWLASRWRHRYWVMFHEVAFPFQRGQPWKHQVLAAVNHLMAGALLRGAARVFISIEQWEPRLRRIALALPPCHWLPVPSNLDAAADPRHARELRRRLAADPPGALVGHFGTFDASVGGLLARVLPPLLARDQRRVGLLVGRNSREFATRLVREHPRLEGRVVGTGSLSGGAVADHLAACDLLLQPYPDGACTRRGSLMAGLALGLPAATTVGALTDTIFFDGDPVAMVAMDRLDDMVPLAEALLADRPRREGMGRAARRLYERYCAVGSVVEAMRGRAAGP
jgi:glycosyltransferase involved in cell wall biosynthesis